MKTRSKINAPFSAHMTATEKWPDGIMFPGKLNTVTWLELTSLWEENVTDSYTRRKGSYNKLES